MKLSGVKFRNARDHNLWGVPHLEIDHIEYDANGLYFQAFNRKMDIDYTVEYQGDISDHLELHLDDDENVIAWAYMSKDELFEIYK